MKIRRVYWELTKNPRIYYEDIEPAVVAEELAAAEFRLEKQRALRRRTRSADGPAEDPAELADDETTDIPLPHPILSPPELEMLEPMNNQIALPLGIQDPEDASPIAGNAADGNMVVDPSSPNPRSDNVNTRYIPSQRGNFNSFSTPYLGDELRDIAHRHSLDYNARRNVSSPRSAGHSFEHQTSNRSPAYNANVPLEFHETATRHSLELSQQNIRSMEQMSRTGREKFVAKAVVEAARRRTAEQSGERRNTDARKFNDGERQGEGQRPGETQRPLVDQVRRIGSPRLLSRLSSRGVSTDNDGRASSSDYGRGSLESRGRDKRSIELTAAMPVEEMAMRNHLPDRDLAERNTGAGLGERAGGERSRARRSGKSSTNRNGSRVGFKEERDVVLPVGGSDELNETSGNRVKRYKSLMNATIIKNLEHHETAKSMQPASYPWIVKKLIPRLGRVASPVEKLFWFGSHRFFIWCVEFCLYFSTVLLAAASASLALLNLQGNEISNVHIASLVLAFVSLLFVLLRIAGIVKKYIFILHNASLVPEAVAIAAIHRVTEKRLSQVQDDVSSDLSGSETEREEEQAAVERRRTLGRFFRSEAESGNMPGIDISEDGTSRVSLEGTLLRARKRKDALRRRISRRRRGGIPAVPVATGLGNEISEVKA